jgi:hypothetical protein
MTNRLRTPLEEEEELDSKLIVEEKVVKDIPDNYLIQFLSQRIFNAEAASRALPFVLFLFMLGMIYIANRNLAEKNIRDIDKINKELKELNSQYKATKAELAFKSTQSEVAGRAAAMGLRTSTQPPQKLTAEEATDEH